jgi:hypothetical protein
VGDSLRPVLVIAGAVLLGSGAAVLVFGGELMDAQPQPHMVDDRPDQGLVATLDGAVGADDVASAGHPVRQVGDRQPSSDGDASDRDAPPGVDLAQVGAPGPWRAGARDASGARLTRLGDRDRGPDTGLPAKTSSPRAPASTVREGVDDAFRAMGVPQPPGHDDMPELDQPLGKVPASSAGRGPDSGTTPPRQPAEADSG